MLLEFCTTKIAKRGHGAQRWPHQHHHAPYLQCKRAVVQRSRMYERPRAHILLQLYLLSAKTMTTTTNVRLWVRVQCIPQYLLRVYSTNAMEDCKMDGKLDSSNEKSNKQYICESRKYEENI